MEAFLFLRVFLRADACGFGIDQVDCFFRLRGWRTRGPSGRALLSITRPQRTRREDPPRLWTPPFSAMCAPRLIYIFAQWGLVQRRMEQVPSRLSYLNLQGGHLHVEWLFLFWGSLSPFWKAERVSPFDFVKMKVLCENVRTGSNTYPLHLHLDEVKRADTNKLHTRR